MIRTRASDGPRPVYELLPALAPGADTALPDTQLSERDRLARAVAERVRRDAVSLSGQYAALDVFLAELQTLLGCEDVLEPMRRDHLEQSHASLASACKEAATFVGTLELPVDDAATRDLLWTRIQQAGG